MSRSKWNNTGLATVPAAQRSTSDLLEAPAVCRMESSNIWPHGSRCGVVGGGGAGIRKKKSTFDRPKARIGTSLSLLAKYTKTANDFVIWGARRIWLLGSRSDSMSVGEKEILNLSDSRSLFKARHQLVCEGSILSCWH